MLSYKSIQGRREYMEDRVGMINGGNKVVCVFDGHGGEEMAEKASQNLPAILHDSLKDFNGSNIQVAHLIQQNLIEYGTLNRNTKSGCTCTGALNKNDAIFIFNIGDSRTCTHLHPNKEIYWLRPEFTLDGKYSGKNTIKVLKTNFFVSRDHDPGMKSECERIKNVGGSISNGRLNGILSLTRAYGDHGVGTGLCYIPDVFWIPKSSINGPVLSYSDGISEPYQDETNLDKHFLYHFAEKHGADSLVDLATQNGSSDNITAVLYNLN